MAKRKHNGSLFDERIIVNDLSSSAGEAYQRLQVNVDLASIDSKLKVIGITSSTKSEGKSTTIVNLANIYARKNKKVCVIDLDLRRPSLHYFFKKPNDFGLVDYVLGEIDKEHVVKHSEEGIDFINTGKHTPFPAQVLESKNLMDLIEYLKGIYDFVLLDCPPILVSADTTIISKFTDGFIFVVKTNSTVKDALGDSLEALRNCGANIIGAVMTDVPSGRGSDYYGYGYYKY